MLAEHRRLILHVPSLRESVWLVREAVRSDCGVRDGAEARSQGGADGDKSGRRSPSWQVLGVAIQRRLQWASCITWLLPLSRGLSLHPFVPVEGPSTASITRAPNTFLPSGPHSPGFWVKPPEPAIPTILSVNPLPSQGALSSSPPVFSHPLPPLYSSVLPLPHTVSSCGTLCPLSPISFLTNSLRFSVLH